MTEIVQLADRLRRPPILMAAGVYDALTALIAERAGFEALYVSGAGIAYTRLGRPDIRLVSVSEVLDTSSAGGRMLITLLGALAQFEREQVSERTSFALSYKRKAGQVYSPIPFGFVREGDLLVPEPREQAALQRARAMAASGSTLRQIGEEFVRLGIQPKRGGAVWHPASVRSILRSRAARELIPMQPDPPAPHAAASAA